MSLSERVGRIRRARRVIGANVIDTNRASDRLLKAECHDQCEAPAPDGCSDSTKRSIRVAPSRSRSIEVAYETRM
jgi:hypothetical protein